jgi:predicted RecA/RadA family phage recombinase
VGPNEVLDKSVEVTGVTAEKRFVRLTGLEMGAQYAGSGIPIGVAQEGADELDVERGRHIRVRMEGISAVEASAAIDTSSGAVAVQVTNDGRVVTFTSGTRVGVALTSASAPGDWVSVHLWR